MEKKIATLKEEIAIFNNYNHYQTTIVPQKEKIAQLRTLYKKWEKLALFENDLVQIERKKIRLHHVREVKPLAFGQRFLKDGLLGRSSCALWIMAIKSDALTEQDVAEFSKECKRYHHKSQRKIMVTLKEVDPNARLRALEEKIWTWDLNSLNQILDLFSKPRVIA